jgi:hypothetical protein
MRRLGGLWAAVLILGASALGGCKRNSATPATAPAASREVTSRGSVEVTATLVEIPGTFPPNKLYDYMYVLKYRVLKVHRGQAPSERIYVAHYNPLKARSEAADKFVKDVGGNVTGFVAGQTHRMAMEPSLDTYMGGIIDKYFGQPGTRYVALWTDYDQP